MDIRDATPVDLAAIESLLQSVNLTAAGVGDHLDTFLVAENGGSVVASAGLEVYGSAALLRSVAVRPDHQGRGLARTLVDRLFDRARRDGVRSLYLLTATAALYFRRFGFAPISHDEVAAPVQASREFTDEQCAGAQAMRVILGEPARGGGE